MVFTSSFVQVTQAQSDHPFARFHSVSPDGQQIAFISVRHGNDDIFGMNANSSNIRRLAYHSTDDDLTGWKGNDELILTTERLYNQVEWEPEIHTISANGGTPTRFFDAFGQMATMSPHRRYLVCVRGYNKEYRNNGCHFPVGPNLLLPQPIKNSSSNAEIFSHA